MSTPFGARLGTKRTESRRPRDRRLSHRDRRWSHRDRRWSHRDRHLSHRDRCPGTGTVASSTGTVVCATQTVAWVTRTVACACLSDRRPGHRDRRLRHSDGTPASPVIGNLDRCLRLLDRRQITGPPPVPSRRSHGRSPVWPRTPRRMYQLLRRERRTHAWAKPIWPPGPTHSRTCSQPPESDREPPHGRSPVWRADPRRSYERSLPCRTPRVAARLGRSFLITP
jgi:hypothetical protein